MESLSAGTKLAIAVGEAIGSMLFGRAVARITFGALYSLCNDDDNSSMMKNIVIAGASVGTGYAGYKFASAGFTILNARLGIFTDVPEVPVDVVAEG